MDVAKELSCIYESQLFELQDDDQVKILAECAVDLMLDLKNPDTFDRDTLLRKVLKDGNMKKKVLLTRNKDVKWSAPNVFRKPGLRKMIFGKNGAEFENFVKPEHKDCKPSKYGYRGQFLQKKEYGNRKKEGENVTHEDPCPNLWEDCSFNHENCSFNHENCTSGYYFGKSDIDSEYTEPQDELCVYRPLHILIQCPKVLVWFMQQENRPSLANFLKNKLPVRLPEHYLVYPVYRPHSPRKVPDLQKSDLTGSDFSHSDFTDSCLEKCNFTRCVMLFANLTGATMCSSEFCKTLISHSDLKDADASSSIWTETSILYSLVDRMDLRGMPEGNYGGIEWEGTNHDKAIKDKPTRITNHLTEVPRIAQPAAQPRQMSLESQGEKNKEDVLPPESRGEKNKDDVLPTESQGDKNKEDVLPPESRGDKNKEDVLPPESQGEKNKEDVLPPESQGDKNKEDVLPPESQGDKNKEDVLPTESQGDKNKDDVLPPESQGEKNKEDVLPTESQGDKNKEDVLPPESQGDKNKEDVLPPESQGDKNKEDVLPPESQGEKNKDDVLPPESQGDKNKDDVLPPESQGDKNKYEIDDKDPIIYIPKYGGQTSDNSVSVKEVINNE